MRQVTFHRSVAILAAALAGCTGWGPFAGKAAADTRTAAFAPADPGVRASAMGGAYTAVGEEPMGLYWNPATLFFQEGHQIEASYSDLYGLGAAKRSYLSYGWKKEFEIPEYDGQLVSLTTDSHSGPGYAFGVESLFFDLDDAGYTEFSIGAGAAWGYGERLAIGASVRGLLVSSDFDQVSAWGYDFGLGLAWSTSSKERIGLAVPHLFSRLIWAFDSTERLPLGATLGWARRFHPTLLTSVDVEMREGDTGVYRVAGGVEWWAFPERLALRGGYRYLDAGLDPISAPTFGLAIRFLGLSLDYAFRVEPAALGDTHRLGLLVGL